MTQKTKNFVLETVNPSDASFILELRTNPGLNQFLSPTTDSLDNQISWLESYKERESSGEEYYFKLVGQNNDNIGTARLYNIDKTSKTCTFGSFIMKPSHPKTAAIEAMVGTLYYAFNVLGMVKVVLDVRVKNEHAKNFYVRFGFEKVDENDLDEFYEISAEKFQELYKQTYHKFMEEEK